MRHGIVRSNTLLETISSISTPMTLWHRTRSKLRFGDWKRNRQERSRIPVGGYNQTWDDYSDPVEWLITWASGNGGGRSHCWLTPRPLIEEAGSWNEDLRINQDGEFFSRVLLRSNGVAFCPDTEVYYRNASRGVSLRRDPKSWKSLYRSYEMILQRILNHEESARAKRSCAARWENFKHAVYPTCPDLAQEAERKISRLGGTDYHVGGSSTYLTLESILGWKMARFIQDKYRKLVY